MVLFVVLNKGIKLDTELIGKIKASIRNNATARHVPAQIHQVNEIPRTISGKKVEIAISKMSNGEKVKNKDVLMNPNSLVEYEKIFKKN